MPGPSEIPPLSGISSVMHGTHGYTDVPYKLREGSGTGGVVMWVPTAVSH